MCVCVFLFLFLFFKREGKGNEKKTKNKKKQKTNKLPRSCCVDTLEDSVLGMIRQVNKRENKPEHIHTSYKKEAFKEK